MMRAHETRPADFDLYSDSYRAEVERAISFAGQNLDYFTQAKARELLDVVDRFVGPPATLTALDVGCGVGMTDQLLAGRFGTLHGVDIAEAALERAASANPSVNYRHYDGRTLPFGDGSVDVAFTICVLHHVPPPQWRTFAQELRRVTRPSGLVVVFEHNPLNPLTRWVVRRCAFDDDAVLLRQRVMSRLLEHVGLEVVEARSILFFPPGGERLAQVERVLGRLPLGAQYYVAARVRHD
jgi:SAM-dependent methyltransferase